MRWLLGLGLGITSCAGPVQEDATVTWHADVAPLLADRCGACHQDGNIAPFSIETYADAAPWAEIMVDSVMSGRMPPFFATEGEECDMDGRGFLDDIRLSDDDKDLLNRWVDAGAPEGDPATAVDAPLRQTLHLESPDAILPILEPHSVSGTQDEYRCFRIEVGNTEDIWITGTEVLPDNDLVVHHALVWNDPEDQSAAKVGPDGSYPCSGQPDVWPTELVAAWTPGNSPSLAPPGAGTLFHPGATLVVNIHYHPTGTTTEIDQTAVALTWTDEQPSNHSTWYLVDIPFGAQPADGSFLIPAGEEAHEETVSLTIPEFVPWDLAVFAVVPHMHYLGTEMLVTVRSGSGGDDTCLVHTPNFRFDFQASYVYDRLGPLPVIRPGDTVDVRCTYNNSASNPMLDLQLEANGTSDPADVPWGEYTGDEMCMAMVGLLIPPIDWLTLAESLF